LDEENEFSSKIYLNKYLPIMIRRTKRKKLFKIAMKRKYGDNQTCDAATSPLIRLEI